MDRADVLSLGVRGDDPRLRPGTDRADRSGRGPGQHGEAGVGEDGDHLERGRAPWRDISIYRASGPLRLAGPIYEVTSYETKAGCEAAQQAAMAKEALSRVGPMTERLSDGIKTWDSDHQHYTTYRYLCRLAGAGPGPFR